MKTNWAMMVSIVALAFGLTTACGDGGFSGDTDSSNDSDTRNAQIQNANQNGQQPGDTSEEVRSDLVGASDGTEIDTGAEADQGKPLECTLPDDLQQKIDQLTAQRGIFGGGAASSSDEGWGGTGNSCIKTYYKVCVNDSGVKRCGEYDVATTSGVNVRGIQYADCLSFAGANGASCEYTSGGLGIPGFRG